MPSDQSTRPPRLLILPIATGIQIHSYSAECQVTNPLVHHAAEKLIFFTFSIIFLTIVFVAYKGE